MFMETLSKLTFVIPVNAMEDYSALWASPFRGRRTAISGATRHRRTSVELLILHPRIPYKCQKKTHIVRAGLIFDWLGMEDSNLHIRSQSPLSCR